jgi:hypothetical protein
MNMKVYDKSTVEIQDARSHLYLIPKLSISGTILVIPLYDFME